MFRKLTLWREEMNLIGQLFLVDSPGKSKENLLEISATVAENHPDSFTGLKAK